MSSSPGAWPYSGLDNAVYSLQLFEVKIISLYLPPVRVIVLGPNSPVCAVGIVGAIVHGPTWNNGVRVSPVTSVTSLACIPAGVVAPEHEQMLDIGLFYHQNTSGIKNNRCDSGKIFLMAFCLSFSLFYILSISLESFSDLKIKPLIEQDRVCQV